MIEVLFMAIGVLFSSALVVFVFYYYLRKFWRLTSIKRRDRKYGKPIAKCHCLTCEKKDTLDCPFGGEKEVPDDFFCARAVQLKSHRKQKKDKKIEQLRREKERACRRLIPQALKEVYEHVSLCCVV